MNIYRVSEIHYQFTLWNLLGELDGHYDFIYNSKTKIYKIKKYADYGNLINVIEVSERYRSMTKPEYDQVISELTEVTEKAVFYGTDKRLVESNRIIIFENTIFNRQDDVDSILT